MIFDDVIVVLKDHPQRDEIVEWVEKGYIHDINLLVSGLRIAALSNLKLYFNKVQVDPMNMTITYFSTGNEFVLDTTHDLAVIMLSIGNIDDWFSSLKNTKVL